MFFGSVAVLFAAPLLFDLVWQGKYADGLALLPLALASCSWLGLLTVAQMYFWCAERATLSCLSLAIGLVLNIGLNALLIPLFGLAGAVIATTTSNFAVLGIVLSLNRRLGMHVQQATVLLALLPLSLLLGPWVAAAALGATAIALWFDRRLLTERERQALSTVWQDYRLRFSAGRKG
jgi:O-antigen/teichoic acid export membrane protein